MKNDNRKPSDVVRYIERKKIFRLEDYDQMYDQMVALISRFKVVDQNVEILEVGVGTGWFPIMCKKKGISCTGLEISAELIEYIKDFGSRYDIEPDIQLGNIENSDIGKSKYDIIIANATFEHVEHWQSGLKNIFDALKPGGLLFFVSTNKFSFISGEYRKIPLYGWMPNRWRYFIRKNLQYKHIMEWGIDFHQFTFFQLRRHFKMLGFSTILDVVDIYDPNQLFNPRLWKKIVLRILKRFKALKHLVLIFYLRTSFICIK